MSIKQKILETVPSNIKNILPTIYNLRLRTWHGKKYYSSLVSLMKPMGFNADVKLQSDKVLRIILSYTDHINPVVSRK